jgi:hypothetical protein
MDSDFRKAARVFSKELVHRPVRCTNCGSYDVRLAYWVNPNAPAPLTDDDLLADVFDGNYEWCARCGSHSVVCEHCEPYSVV